MKGLWKFACVDSHYLSYCSHQHRQHHTVLGLMLLVITLLSSFAAGYAISYVTGNYLSIDGIGLCFGLSITNLYRFIFCSLSGNTIYFEGYQTSRLQITTADIVRVFFLGFLGLAIAEMLELMIFKPSLDPLFVILKGNPESTNYQALQSKLNLTEIEAQRFKIDSMLSRFSLMYKAYSQKLWFFRVPIIVMFLIPLFLKSYLHIIRNGEYERIKYQHDTLYIRNAYYLTKEYIQRLFKELVDVEISDYELYEDPPFNTRRIQRERNPIFTRPQ
ncbi:DUF4407 domain-containing protein [Runella limosa]|uniref:DUF4407 domain-containing protein n=1 Tax=Runella limosa TaxID=370978 RepID=UPI000400F95B|nr:DUF4407 domain-containing protein [Runella limosa]